MATREELATAPARPVLLRDKGDIGAMAAGAGGARRQPLRGFDPDYVDIVDYIVRLTHRIWEEKAVGLIYDTYAHNVALWTTDGLTKGREAIIANTLRALAANPDPRIYVDEVIWAGDEDDGFHTSMLYTAVCHNTGHSAFGPPTGRRFAARGIANCYVLENRIVEEWTTSDGLSVVRQLGFDPHEAAARLARGRGTQPPLRGESERAIGQFAPVAAPPMTGDFDLGDFLGGMVREVWNRRLLNRVNDFYAPGFIGHASTAKELYGPGDLKLHILTLLGAFPDATLAIDHLYWLHDPARREYRTALRWTLTGTHDGPGIYGPPTGRRVHLLGISQHRIRDERIVEEWAVYDEFALLKQVVGGD